MSAAIGESKCQTVSSQSTESVQKDAQLSLSKEPPKYIESLTVTSGATVRNTTALVGGETILIQSSHDIYVLAGIVTDTVASTSGVLVLANEKFILTLGDGRNQVALDTHVLCIASSTTATVKLHRLR